MAGEVHLVMQHANDDQIIAFHSEENPVALEGEPVEAWPSSGANGARSGSRAACRMALSKSRRYRSAW
jgi:hypothetical protein